MALPDIFRYNSGSSPVHRFDPRWKTGSLFVLCITVFITGPAGLFLILFALGGVTALSGISFRMMLGSLKPFYILGGIVLVSGVFFTRGGTSITDRIPAATWDGLVEGGIGALKLLLFAVTGALFFSTTTFVQIRDAFTWFLRPVPGIPEDKAGLMLGLTLTFLPSIFLLRGQIADAQASRCIGINRNPLKRVRLISLPLIRNILVYANNITDAVESRAYGGRRTPPRLRTRRGDPIAAALTAVLCGISIAAGKLVVLF